MSSKPEVAEVSEESLYRIFTIPEAPDSTLSKIEKHLSENLMGFLGDHIVAREKLLQEIERDFDRHKSPKSRNSFLTIPSFC